MFEEMAALVMQVVGGLGIFLLGMKHMSEGIQAVAGNSLRRMISAVTDNRVMAVGAGTGVTCLVQSSSVTTVIVIGLVNAGFMALHQALGVIMGANIGTTITGWILVLKIGKYGLPMLGLAAFFYLFSKKDRWRFIAMAVMGIGMVFFGLELMKDGFAMLKELDKFEEAFTWFDARAGYLGTLKCVMIGCLLTFIVQSSSATLGITIGLASTGVIPFASAAALVLGENIGTTITAWIASLGANRTAKRAAYGHILFNVIGVAWITAVFQWYLPAVNWFVGHARGGAGPLDVDLSHFSNPADYAALVTAGIAATHSGFNIVNMLLFLPFVRRFARLLEWLVPDRGVKEIPHLRHLDTRMVDSPVMAIEQSRNEMLKMGRGTLKILDWTQQTCLNGEMNDRLVQKAFHREEVLDAVEQEMVIFLSEVLDGNVPHSVTEEARTQLRITHELESVSDAAISILKGYLKLRQENLQLTDMQKSGLMNLHDQVREYLRLIQQAVEVNRHEVITKAQSMGAAITRQVKELRDLHLEMLSQEKINPVLSMTYVSLLTNYRRLKEHALNIAEALADHRTFAAA